MLRQLDSRRQILHFYVRSRRAIRYLGCTGEEGLLCRSKLDGSERVQLTVAPIRAAMPRWSSDGKHIAFMGSLPGRNWKIYIVSTDGGSLQQITFGKGNDGDPNWSPDGNLLVFGEEPDSEAGN